LAGVGGELRAAGEVEEARKIDVDAEVVVERGEDLLEVHGAILGVFVQAIG
jgi:hypothetical protein